jgi:hypothetical protein
MQFYKIEIYFTTYYKIIQYESNMPLFNFKLYYNNSKSRNIKQKIEKDVEPDFEQMNRELECYFKRPVIYSCNCCLKKEYEYYIRNNKYININSNL